MLFAIPLYRRDLFVPIASVICFMWVCLFIRGALCLVLFVVFAAALSISLSDFVSVTVAVRSFNRSPWFRVHLAFRASRRQDAFSIPFVVRSPNLLQALRVFFGPLLCPSSDTFNA